MENGHTPQEGEETSEELPQSAADVHTHDRAKKAEENRDQTSQTKRKQKWSLMQHWDEASKIKRVEWVGGSIIFLAALVYYGTQIVSSILSPIQAEKHFANEQRPYILIIEGVPVEVRILNSTFGNFLASAFPIRNSGKSPAMHVLIAAEVLSGDKLDTQVADWYPRMGMPIKSNYDDLRKMYALPNGIEVPESTIIQEGRSVVSAEDIKGMIADKPPASPPVAVVARIQYRDMSDNLYWTDLCYYVGKAQTSGVPSQLAVPCPGYPEVH